MPNTRKKVIKTVYKEEDDSETEKAAGDFSDSGSEAYISEHPSSEEDYVESDASSGHEFHDQTRKKTPKARTVRKKTKFAKEFISKINKQKTEGSDSEQGDCTDAAPVFISVKDLTDADKLLPPVLNLSESDSSEDESSKLPTRKHNVPPVSSFQNMDSDSDTEANTEYKDVWSNNIQDNSEEIAKKTFLELEQHKSKIEETKASILSYSSKITDNRSSDVKDLLAQGEEVLPQIALPKKGRKGRKIQDDSDSDMEDWEEVKEAKAIPRQGLQLIVDMPDSVCRKTKKLDVEMMMKRKINRVKKEHQVFMHKVHVLCWIAHGNYVSRILNDQEVLTAALSLVPSKECYPGARVDMKYVEQITTWYKDKLTLKQDKNEDKYRPKALPLKEILLEQSKRRIVTSKKYLVFIFVSMLRALGLQCRVMFNFVTVPLKPPSSVLLSLSTKPKDGKTVSDGKQIDNTKDKANKKGDVKKSKPKVKISQVDGNDDSFSSLSESENIIQLDGNDDALTVKTRSKRATKNNVKDAANENEDVSPPKRVRKSPSPHTVKEVPVESKEEDKALPQKRKRTIRKTQDETESESSNCGDKGNNIGPRKRAVRRSQDQTESDACHKSDKGNSADQRKRTIRKSQDKSDPSNTADKGNNVGQRPRAIRKCQNKTESDASNNDDKGNSDDFKPQSGIPLLNRRRKISSNDDSATMNRIDVVINKKITVKSVTPLKTSHATKRVDNTGNSKKNISPKSDKVTKSNLNPPIITVTNEEGQTHTSQYFEVKRPTRKLTSLSLSRERSQTANPIASPNTDNSDDKRVRHTKSRTISAPAAMEKSKYFDNKDKGEITEIKKQPRRNSRRTNKDVEKGDVRVSHRDLISKTRIKQKNDVTADLVNIIKGRVKEAKEESRKGLVKGKVKKESDDDSDFLAEEVPKRNNSDSDDDFKPTKISPKPSTSRKPIDRRVLSSDEEIPKNRIDVWCEIFVEELEQWIAVDVIKGKAHCVNDLYRGATNPVCYVVGWDNNNYLKDLTRRYVPHWNTVTRKQRAEPGWWDTAVQPWLGAKTARDREEDEQLNRMQLEAPLPKSIAEYKNHPLYALKRHLLKFEALYPPDAVTLGFVRGEPVYARECVHVCRSRDTWLKEAKVVRLGEEPYKIVKARPKWDRLSNKLITDKPLEVFGPWQVQDYEPPVAENGVVPRNAYGNVELFKDCMLPKGTVHIKLPGLNRVAKKLNIDCAPAMTGFDFNGGWSHPVYNGFVVCEEFGELITDAWVKDQEEQERKEREKIEARVYGNWRRLVNGLLIRERLKNKYGFEKPSTSQDKKAKGPRLVVKKKS